MNNQNIIDLTASSPAPEAEAAMPSSTLPEPIGAGETPPSSPPRAPRRLPAPAPVKLRWDPTADPPRKQRAGPSIPARAAEGTPELTAFFAPIASGSGSTAAESNVVGSADGGNSVGKKRLAEEEPLEAPASKKAKKQVPTSELLATSPLSLDGNLVVSLPTLSIIATTRTFAKAQVTKGIDMCRGLASSTSREFRRCPEGHRHWGRVKSDVLAEMALSCMSDEAVKALTTRGASVIREGPESKTAEAHQGPGLYLQVVAGTSPRTVYVGKSDVSVKVRQQGWQTASRRARDGKAKGTPARIVQARLDPSATTFAAVSLLALPTEEGWFTASHNTLHEQSGKQRPAEEPALDLRNTLCSLLEAALIAAMGTCQQKDAYMARWSTVFGGGMLEVNRVREGLTPRAEKVHLRRGAYLESVGNDVVHSSVAQKRTVVGQGSLQDFVAAYFGTSLDIGSVLIAAEIEYAVKQGPEHEIRRDLTQDFGSKWAVVWPTTCHLYPALPKWLHEKLGLQSGRHYQISFRFSYQACWYTFQRVTDQDAAAVEGAQITVQSIDTVSEEERSERVSLCAVFASDHWMLVHKMLAEALRRKEEGTHGLKAQDDEETEESDGTGLESEGSNVQDDQDQVEDGRVERRRQAALQTLIRGSYAVPGSLVGGQLGRAWSLHVTVGLPKVNGRRPRISFTLPVRATPPELQDTPDSASQYTVFLRGDVTKRPPLAYLVKKNARLTERPDSALFRLCEVRADWTATR